MNWSIADALRDIKQRSRPRACTERQASGRASYLAQQGLARRTGYTLAGARSVAEYELTTEGLAMLADSEAA